MYKLAALRRAFYLATFFFNITVEYNSRRTRGAEEYEDRVRVDTGTVENDEVARSGRTGVTTAYIENMFSRERTMDCA